MNNSYSAEELAYELQDWVSTPVVIVRDGESFKVNVTYNNSKDVVELSIGERVS